MKINGYRIQVYFGDNSRKGKTEARAAGLRFRNSFAELPVYVSFVSPHWLCRAGDFRTMEEASDVLRQIREMGIFPEAVIYTDREPEFSVARGLAWCGRIDHELRCFREDVDKLVIAVKKIIGR